MVGRRGAIRLGLAAVIVASAVTVTAGVLGSPADAATVAGEQSPENAARTRVAPSAEGVTVITTDSNVWLAD